MTKWQRLLWGGLGGISPVLLMLVTKDIQNWMNSFTYLSLIGFIIRALALFIVGAMLSSLQNEKSKLKAFQLGIVAPAMLTTFINGTKLPNDSNSIGILKPTIYAQTNEIKLLKIEELPAEYQVLYGFMGKEAAVKDNYIILEQCNTLEDAKMKQKEWQVKYPKKAIKIVNDKKGSLFYITIEDVMTAKQAEQLQLNILKNSPIEVIKKIEIDPLTQKDMTLNFIKMKE